MRYRISIPPAVGSMLKYLHPALKAKIKAALKLIEDNPYVGKSLRGGLAGLMNLRATHYRIVYRISIEERMIEVVDIGPRKTIYEKLFKFKP